MKKIATLFYFMLVMLATLLSANMMAQCPGSITASAITTSASCPSSGSATISTTPAATASFTYMITAGPAGALLNTPQSSNVFNALLPGSYTVEASCGAVHGITSFVINNAYSPITNVSAIASASCGAFAQGGTVNISVTGGRAPFQYSILKSNDPNYSDALSMYNGTPNKTVTSFGNYQVRVKDACNQFYTVTVQVSSTLRPVTIGYSPANLTSCSPTSYKFFYAFSDAVTGAELDFSPYNAAGGVKVNVYEQAAGTCTPAGSMLMSFTATGSGHSDITLPAVSSMKYFCQVITPCGDTTNQCFDASHVFDPAFSMWYSTQGCGTAGDPLVEHIAPAAWHAGVVYPLSVSLYQGNSVAGTLIGTKIANNEVEPGNGTLNFNNLAPAEYYMSATDACGHVFTQLIPAPAAAGAPSLDLEYTSLGCTAAGIGTQSGAVTVVFTLNGFIPNLSTATVVIISGPSRVGAAAYVNGGGTVIWTDLLPGSYTAAITTTCGTFNLAFVVPNDPNNLLKQNIAAASSFTCGAGSGLVTATTDYNGGLTPGYVLVNASTNMGVDSNATGIFSSVVPGQYYVRLKLVNNTTCTNTAGYYVNSNTVTIAAAGAGPVVAKKLGVVCEDAGGNPLTTGTAYLSIQGGSPLLVEYKLTSSGTWITFSSNASSEISIPGLSAGSIYDIRVTSCGITSATQVTIDQLGHINDTNIFQPCSGSPYQLALPLLPGAVYEWKNAAGSVISTSNTYNFGSYNSSFNGVYIGTLTWGACVKRTDTVTLNSMLCGNMILPVQLTMFTATNQNCTVTLRWKNASESDNTSFIVERSDDGKNYTNIGNVQPTNNGNYMFTDNSQQQGSMYYRLKMKSAEGFYEYSNSLLVNSRCNSTGTQWSAYPTMVAPGQAVTVKLNTSGAIAGNVKITVSSATGQVMNAQNIAVHPGQNTYTLANDRLPTGTYILCLYDNKGQQIGPVQKLVFIK